MSDLEQFIAAELIAALDRKIRDLGYWCPRCNCAAYPFASPWWKWSSAAFTPGETPGWCPICGMDPRDPGEKPPPATVRGILHATDTPGFSVQVEPSDAVRSVDGMHVRSARMRLVADTTVEGQQR